MSRDTVVFSAGLPRVLRSLTCNYCDLKYLLILLLRFSFFNLCSVSATQFFTGVYCIHLSQTR